MSYLLTILTSGRNEYLARTIEAFIRHVVPMPDSVFIYDDGETTDLDIAFRLNAFCDDILLRSNPKRLGQCAAQAECWAEAAASPHEWTFHLEDDMVVLAPLDLDAIIDLMDYEPHLAQMALVRTPWGTEVEYGGYIAQTPNWYTRRSAHMDVDDWAYWMEQTRNWTNACSLHRTDLCRTFDWPVNAGCETAIGPMLLEADPDIRFGLWGEGECNVAHIGVERAEGSHGY